MKTKKELLITTAIKESHECPDSAVFLGRWCDSKNDIVDTIDYHYNDRNKFNKNYKYIDSFYESLIPSISSALNNYHNTNYSTQYWLIIIGPWLKLYISSAWDRWECLRVAFEKYEFNRTILINSNIITNPPNYYNEADYLYGSSHYWNHLFFSKILKAEYTDKIKIESLVCNNFSSYKTNKSFNKETIRDLLIYSIDKTLEIFQISKKVLIFDSYFKLSDLFKVSISLKQIPRLFKEFNKTINLPDPSIHRKNFNIIHEHKNSFELFVINNIPLDIPVAYIEGYETLKKQSNAINLIYESIFTANAHIHNDLFKVFCAEKCNSGQKLVISQHGGGFHLKHSLKSHEIKISDVNIMWGVSNNKKQIGLPSQKIFYKNVKRKKTGDITIIGVEFPLYTKHHTSGIHSSATIDDYNQKVKFINNINNEIYKNIKVRPYINCGWNLKKRYIKKFGSDIISPYKSLIEAFSNSKLIICTYPETTFSEAIYSGVPTIMLFKEEYWEMETKSLEIVNMMKDAKIIFSDPIKAANHINTIWNNPYDWWDSEKTSNIRNIFINEFIGDDDRKLTKWIEFFEQLNK